MLDPYELGRQDYIDGVLFNNCPFYAEYSNAEVEWIRGWLDARDELLSKLGGRFVV